MKKFLIPCIVLAFLMGCKETPNVTQNQVQLEEIITKLQNGEKVTNVPQTSIDNAQTMIDRSYAFNYQLINTHTLKQWLQDKQVILIDASPKGKYLLEHLKGAKHFEFDSTFLSPDGKLTWNSQKGSQEKFSKKLGNNLFATLVFYDQSTSSPYQATPADIASMWAKKMGYHNVYRLIGDLASWKAQGLLTTNEAPKCCQ